MQGESRFLGFSKNAANVRAAIVRAARVDCPVLVLGESGVGKELVAREIHARSARDKAPFITVNCAAIPETLIESELFGHDSGAFTDAKETRRGAFELAHRGTLFLDEVGELSSAAQAKLLRAIELGEIRRVGGERVRQVDIRVIAATNQDLASMRREGSFRSDLYFRLDVLELHIPPLRERLEDIPELVDHFARVIARKNQRPFLGVTPAGIELLASHSWPGNIRELRSVLERAMALCPGSHLDSSCLSMHAVSHPGLTLAQLLQSDWHEARRGFETAYITHLLDRHGQNVTAAAGTAKLTPRGVYKILARLGLRSATPTSDEPKPPAGRKPISARPRSRPERNKSA